MKAKESTGGMFMSSKNEYLKIYSEVKDAITNNIPVVALESTLISHGMPYPENIETVVALGDIIRKNGAVPATIAIINGKLKIGVSYEELEILAKNKDVIKASTRDIPYFMSKGLNGATTVAATMFIASLAKIKVFATGGIGGVHRNGAQTFDISADLTELSKTNLAVVCAGAKSILDIGLTLEKLETLEVPVIGYKTSMFPAFYLRKSQHRVSYRLDTPEEIAKALKIKWDLGITGGAVIANPIPKEYELDSEMIERAIERALKDAEAKGIRGKELTPYLLSVLNHITSGQSLKANIALVKNNAELAAKLSVELEKLYQLRLPFEKNTTL